jgi:hypothetical protein
MTLTEKIAQLRAATKTYEAREGQVIFQEVNDWPSLFAVLSHADALLDAVELVERLVIERWPCANCTFALATHGSVDAAFGVSNPLLCDDCARANASKATMAPSTKYDALTKSAIDVLARLVEAK